MTDLDHLYYIANREKILERQKKYDEAHREEKRVYKILWNGKNQSRRKIYNQWYKLFGKKPRGITYEEMEIAIKVFLGTTE